MGKTIPAGAKSLSDREQDLLLLLGKRMNDAAYTQATFFKMKSMYERRDLAIGIFVVGSGGLLTVGIAWESFPTAFNAALAIGISIISFFGRYLGYGKQATDAEKAADAYNSILKELQAYYYLVLKDKEIPFEEKREQLDRLLRRYDDLNNNTISTDPRAYSKIGDQDVVENLEMTDEELEALLTDRNIRSAEESSAQTQSAVNSQ